MSHANYIGAVQNPVARAPVKQDTLKACGGDVAALHLIIAEPSARAAGAHLVEDGAVGLLQLEVEDVRACPCEVDEDLWIACLEGDAVCFGGGLGYADGAVGVALRPGLDGHDEAAVV